MLWKLNLKQKACLGSFLISRSPALLLFQVSKMLFQARTQAVICWRDTTRYGPFIPDISKTLKWEDAEFSQLLFQHLMKWSCIFFPWAHLYNGWIDGFLYIGPFLHPWNEAYLIMVNDHFVVFLDSVCNNFIEYFCINIHKGNWSEVLFFGWVFVWFRYQSNCGFIERVM